MLRPVRVEIGTGAESWGPPAAPAHSLSHREFPQACQVISAWSLALTWWPGKAPVHSPSPISPVACLVLGRSAPLTPVSPRAPQIPAPYLLVSVSGTARLPLV